MNINNIDIFKERIVKECAACQSYTLIISALLNLTDFLLLFCLHDSIHLNMKCQTTHITVCLYGLVSGRGGG